MKYTTLIAFRVTDTERQALDRMARAVNGDRSNTLRQLIREAAQARKCWPWTEVEQTTTPEAA